MRPLPASPFVYAQWRIVTIGSDYHAEVDHRYYSVPHTYAHEKVEVRTTPSVIEFFHKGIRIASHPVSTQPIGSYITNVQDMPASHRAYDTMNQDHFLQWADTVGPFTRELVTQIFLRHSVPQAHIRSCMGLQKSCSSYGNDRFEKACHIALLAKCYGSSYVEQILKTHVEEKMGKEVKKKKRVWHANIRGKEYYQQKEN